MRPKDKKPDEIQMRIGAAFGGASSQIRKMDEMKNESLNLWELQQLAIQLNFCFSEVKYAQTLFQELDVNGNGTLDYDEFEKLVARLVGGDASQKQVRKICREKWGAVANQRTSMINFLEFLQWYAKLTFTERSNRTDELATQHGVSLEVVEQVKLAFDQVDSDGSGKIELNEFKRLLSYVMRIPADIELPKSRVAALWMDLDRSGDGQVTFDEFLPWWLKRKDSFLPYENFYAGIRRVGPRILDPDPYVKANHDGDDDGTAKDDDDEASFDHDGWVDLPGLWERAASVVHSRLRAKVD